MKTKTSITMALTACLLNPFHTYADSLESAIERTNSFKSKNWSFQVISKGEENTVEQYNPQQSPEWSLNYINGEKPSTKQLNAYRINKEQEEDAEEEEDEGGVDLNEMLESDSLKLISEDANMAKYSFTPLLEDDDVDFTGKLKGELWHNKQRNYIERFDFFSIKPFSPMTGVKIKNMRTSIRFKEIDNDVFAPDQIFSEVSGNAFIVKKIDEKESQTYANYQRVVTKVVSK